MTNSLFDLTGRVALVTGGSKGLGKAMARGFAEAGANVVISSRHEEELKTSLGEILDGTGCKGTYLAADMTNRDDISRLAEHAVQQLGRVDILVNNAGSNVPQETEEIVDTDWDTIIELNLTSCMRLTRALVGPMKKRRWGRIIHISSVMGFGSKEGRSAYSATKTGLLGLARAQAIEFGSFGITVNCIAPGPFLTDLPGSLLTQAQKDFFASRTAIGRWGDPRELAGPALLLASDAGSYVTGTTLVVDGGNLSKIF